MSADPDEVPKLPRGRWLKVSGREVITILMLVTCLVAVLALREGCAQGVANLFRAFDPVGDAGPGGPVVPRP